MLSVAYNWGRATGDRGRSLSGDAVAAVCCCKRKRAPRRTIIDRGALDLAAGQREEVVRPLPVCVGTQVLGAVRRSHDTHVRAVPRAVFDVRLAALVLDPGDEFRAGVVAGLRCSRVGPPQAGDVLVSGAAGHSNGCEANGHAVCSFCSTESLVVPDREPYASGCCTGSRLGPQR